MVQISLSGVNPENSKKKFKCSHCGRWVRKHIVVQGKLYGQTCAKVAIQKIVKKDI